MNGGHEEPSVNAAWVKLFGSWAERRIEAARPPAPTFAEFARLSRNELHDRVIHALERAAVTPPTPPIGEVDQDRAALCLDGIVPVLDAVEAALAPMPAGAPRARARVELLAGLHRFLVLCYAPAGRGLVWMPDDQWRLLHDAAGRDGRVRRSIARLGELLERPTFDLSAVREQMVLLERLFGPGALATPDQLLVLERLAEVLHRLPVNQSFADPVADACHACRQLLRRARGDAPIGDVLSP
jgi:hypothetical protein